MKSYFLLPLCLLLSAAAPAEPELQARARAAADQMQSALQSALKGALESGGPAQAIEVCHQLAPELARSVARQHGIGLMRVSLRTRNPANRPDLFERRVLTAWQQSGDTAPVSEVESLGQQRFYRYLQPITTQPLCLQCHGNRIQPDVQALLDTYYPQDQASGYSTGELRGAFSVTIPLGQAQD